MSVKEAVQHAAQNPKVASVVSCVTTGTGLGTIFDYIPNDIGKLATLMGVILSAVLIWVHMRRGFLENRKTRLENKKLELEVDILENKKKATS